MPTAVMFTESRHARLLRHVVLTINVPPLRRALKRTGLILWDVCGAIRRVHLCPKNRVHGDYIRERWLSHVSM